MLSSGFIKDNQLSIKPVQSAKTGRPKATTIKIFTMCILFVLGIFTPAIAQSFSDNWVSARAYKASNGVRICARTATNSYVVFDIKGFNVNTELTRVCSIPDNAVPISAKIPQPIYNIEQSISKSAELPQVFFDDPYPGCAPVFPATYVVVSRSRQSPYFFLAADNSSNHKVSLQIICDEGHYKKVHLKYISRSISYYYSYGPESIIAVSLGSANYGPSLFIIGDSSDNVGRCGANCYIVPESIIEAPFSQAGTNNAARIAAVRDAISNANRVGLVKGNQK